MLSGSGGVAESDLEFSHFSFIDIKWKETVFGNRNSLSCDPKNVKSNCIIHHFADRPVPFFIRAVSSPLRL